MTKRMRNIFALVVCGFFVVTIVGIRILDENNSNTLNIKDVVVTTTGELENYNNEFFITYPVNTSNEDIVIKVNSERIEAVDIFVSELDLMIPGEYKLPTNTSVSIKLIINGIND